MEKSNTPKATVYEEDRGLKALVWGPDTQYTVKDENGNTIKETGDKEEAFKAANEYDKKFK